MSTETQVGAALGQGDMADRLTSRIEDTNAVKIWRSHTPAAPEISVDVDTKSIGCAGFRIHQNPEGPSCALRSTVITPNPRPPNARVMHAAMGEGRLLPAY